MLRPLLILSTIIPLLNAAEPVHWGINGHPVTQEGYWQVPLEEQLDLVKESGAGWYRISFTEKTFRANTDRIDTLVKEAKRREIRILPALLPSPDFFENAPLETIRANAVKFGRDVAERYHSDITHWELGNELDNHALIRAGETTPSGKKWIWEGQPEGSEPDDYETVRYERSREFIKAVGDGVKQADPKALTMVDTAGWLHYGFIERLRQDDAADFDILAWHWYSEMGDITAASDKKIDVLKLLKDRYAKPIWITEINRRDGSKGGREKEQADYIANDIATLAKHPDVRAIFLYELLDEPYFGGSGESDYGLVRISKDSGKWKVSGKKPAFGALEKCTGSR